MLHSVGDSNVLSENIRSYNFGGFVAHLNILSLPEQSKQAPVVGIALVLSLIVSGALQWPSFENASIFSKLLRTYGLMVGVDCLLNYEGY